MSLLDAIAKRIETHSDFAAVRTALGGTGKVWSDIIPDEDKLEAPYVVLSESDTSVHNEVKGKKSSILDITVEYEITATSRESLEDIRKKLQTASYPAFGGTYEPAPDTHLSTMFGNRTSFHQDGKWVGSLELVYRVQEKM